MKTDQLYAIEKRPIEEIRAELARHTDPLERLPLLTALGLVTGAEAPHESQAYTQEAQQILTSLPIPAHTRLLYEAHFARNEAYRLAHRGEYREALEKVDQASRLYQDNDPDGEGSLDSIRATVYFLIGDYHTAHECAARALALGERINHLRLITTSLSMMGSVAALTKNYELAISCYTRCADFYEAHHYRRGMAKIHNNMGHLYMEMNRWPEALDMAQRAIRTYQQLGTKYGESRAYDLLGDVYIAMGDYAAAEAAHQTGLALAKSVDDLAMIVGHTVQLARLKQLQGQFAAAVEGYEAVLPLSHESRLREYQATILENLSHCWEQLGDYRRALDYFRQFRALEKEHETLAAAEKFKNSQAHVEAKLAKATLENVRLKMAETQRQLEHADRLSHLGRIVAGLTHEINNHLQIIYGNLQLALDADAGQRSTLEPILDQTRRIMALTAQMQQAYQLDARDQMALDVAQEIHKTLQLLHKALAQRHIRLQTAIPAELPTLWASPTHLQQVLMNVGLNAMQAMPEGGLLTVSARYSHAAEEVILVVEDTGIGIPPDLLGRIFDPFFTTRPDGSGLGLTLVQHIVQYYGGKVQITSEVGVGSRVALHFPINTPMRQPTHDQRAAQTDSHC